MAKTTAVKIVEESVQRTVLVCALALIDIPVKWYR